MHGGSAVAHAWAGLEGLNTSSSESLSKVRESREYCRSSPGGELAFLI